MGRHPQQREADVFIGVITWQGDEAEDGPPAAEAAEVIRLAPYLLARQRQAVRSSRRT